MAGRPFFLFPGSSGSQYRTTPAWRGTSASAALCLVTGLLLSGCAAQLSYRDGKEFIAQDKIEEGLAKFQEASAQDPQNFEYRVAYLQTRERAVSTYLSQADRFAVSGKRAEAEKLYQRVLAIDAGSERAQDGLRKLSMSQRHAALLKEAQIAWAKKDGESAQFKLRTILNENPDDAGALALRQAISEALVKPPLESTLSAAYKKKISIEFKDAALKQVFEVIARTSGLNFLFDKDVKADQKTSIFLKNSTIESAVHFMLLTNQLEQQVLDANTILIYPNTSAKQKDYQEMVVKTFFLTNADAKMVANTLKSILKTRDIVIDEKLNMLIMRDSPEVIKLAEKLVALHDVPEPEVMLEVEILEVTRTRLQQLGIQWPSSLTLTPLSLSGDASSALTLRDLGHQNSGTIGVGNPNAVVNANVTDSDANLLANPRIRTRNHEKAKILIGQRVPNITTTATSTGFVSESINYVDVGLTLNVEPTIYLDNDVAIKVSMEVSNIISQITTKGGSTAYQIGTRTASTVLSLKDGETQVLAGLINDEDRRGGNKLPGIGEIPILGRLFGTSSDNKQKTEIVLSITPHLIRNIQRPDTALSEFRSGTDTSFRVRPEGGGSAPAIMMAPPVNDGTSGMTTPVLNTPSATPTNPGATPAAVNAGGVPAAALSGTQLQWQGPAQVKSGDLFAVQLMMQSDQPVTSLPMAVGFDKQVLQVVSITEGDFLKQGGAQTTFNSKVDNAGKILMTGTRTGDGGSTSLGTIATINFKALSAVDTSPVQLLTLAAVGAKGSQVSVALPQAFRIQVQP
ncbi:cohesin domain-containing protein [Collimonas sp. NPDC087041]|uniref:cohesin domain-containing protein n=1 Tax=Collimonas sp. NPDC087041 TaxID=3363960 RepID=UPI0037F5BF0D